MQVAIILVQIYENAHMFSSIVGDHLKQIYRADATHVCLNCLKPFQRPDVCCHKIHLGYV